MAKVLYTTPILEHPTTGGPELRVENSIKALSRVSELHIISRVHLDLMGGMEAQKFYEKYCVNFLYAPSVGKQMNQGGLKFQNQSLNSVLEQARDIKLINKTGGFILNLYFNGLLHRRQKTIMQVINRDVDFILDYCDKNMIDVIWFGRGPISFDLIYKIIKRRPDIRVVYDTEAVYKRYILRRIPYTKSWAEKFRIYRQGKRFDKEANILLNLAAVTTAVSDVDAQYYRSILNAPEKVRLFSNVMDVEDYEHVPPQVNDFKKPCLYFAGSFSSLQGPMADAARWMITEILPLVRRQVPNIHLYIAGKGSDEVLSDIADAGITMTGKLPSLLPYLGHADIAIVPLRFESGTRFKILEAGACGIPVVSTTLGAEGLSVTNGRDILIADEPESFADAVTKLIMKHDLAMEIGKNLKILVKGKYSITSLSEEARSILDYLMCL